MVKSNSFMETKPSELCVMNWIEKNNVIVNSNVQHYCVNLYDF